MKSLNESVGWKLIQKIIDQNIKFIEQRIIEGRPNETKQDIDLLRHKLQAYKDVMNTPLNYVKQFESMFDEKQTSDIISDPYE